MAELETPVANLAGAEEADDQGSDDEDRQFRDVATAANAIGRLLSKDLASKANAKEQVVKLRRQAAQAFAGFCEGIVRSCAFNDLVVSPRCVALSLLLLLLLLVLCS